MSLGNIRNGTLAELGVLSKFSVSEKKSCVFLFRKKRKSERESTNTGNLQWHLDERKVLCFPSINKTEPD